MMLLLAFQTASLFGLIVASISTSSMVAEIVETHEVDHGTRIEGVFFAGYLMTQKFGEALGKIGRAHVSTPLTNTHLACRLLLDKKKKQTHTNNTTNINRQ